MVAQRCAIAAAARLRSLLPGIVLGLVATLTLAACTSTQYDVPTPTPSATVTTPRAVTSTATTSPPTISTPVATPQEQVALDPVRVLTEPREPGIVRTFTGPSGKVERTDYSDGQTVSWNWGGGQLSGKNAAGVRWHSFADGSTAYWDDAGNTYLDKYGARVMCSWSGRCPSSPGGWPAAIDREHAAVQPQLPGGRITGDPHIETRDGTRFSTQLAGEFFGRTSPDGHDYQLRTIPMPGRTDVSLVSAVAIDTGDHRVTVSSHPAVEVRIDGKLQKRPEDFAQIDLDDGSTAGVWAPGSRGDLSQRPFTVAVLWPDLSDVHLFVSPVYGITITTAWPAGSAALGLLGDENADPADDLTTRTGSLTLDSQIFAESWRIEPTESLFDYAATGGNESYTLLWFPQTSATLIPSVQTEARQSCSAAGITDESALDACVFDVAVTGDPGFVIGHRILAETAAGFLRDRQLSSWLAVQLGEFAGEDLTLSREDTESAEAVGADGHVDLTLATGQSHTALLIVAEPARIRVTNSNASCDETVDGQGDARYQLFDESRNVLSQTWSACADGVGQDVGVGAYYVKFIGPDQGEARRFSVVIRAD